ncbi:MAG: hypothetical protein U1F43_28400 [Myxococcota bacterium]
MLYELVEHRRPWLETDPDVLFAARNEGPPVLTSPSCPPSLATLVRRLLAAHPQDRPQSAAETLAALSEATGWDVELEPADAFVQHLLSVPLPWREQLGAIADMLCDDRPPAWAVVLDTPPGYFARRLLGPVLDVAAQTGARVVPLRFDERYPETPAISLDELFADDRRPLFVVLENVDAADAGTLAIIERHRRPHTRLVATRAMRDAPLPAFLRGDDVRLEALAPWSEEAMRSWIARALGPVELPVEALPPTPAALVEAMGAMQREGHLVRREDGYHYRAEGTGRHARPDAPPLDPTRRMEALDALLSCVKAPVPESALAAYLGSLVDALPELIARGILQLRGNGTVQVADEARRAISYGRLPRARRDALHRRLAQALEETGASPHRIADEWLESGAPLLAVPHLLAAAELRPGRSWLQHSLALVARARELVVAAGSASASQPDLQLWRYEALVIRSEARVLLACGELEAIDSLVEELVGLGMDMGHRHTIQSALELRLALDQRRRDWNRLVGDALTVVTLDGNLPSVEARATLHWARGLRFRADGLPTAALTELEAGLETLGPSGGIEVCLRLLAARAELSLDVEWRGIAEQSIATYLDVATRAGRAEDKARARTLEAARLRMIGRLDRALALAQETAECLPRQRLPRLDGEVELELGWCHLELGGFAAARDHARFAVALGEDDGDHHLVSAARALEATAAWYLGDLAAAWLAAQRAARVLVLELALAERGFAGADIVLLEASEAGWHAQRRLESSRAARAFRIAAEAALVRGEPRLAVEQAERALACMRAEGVRHVHLPRHLVTAARAWSAFGDGDRADALLAEAWGEVMALAESIDDLALRNQWLAHPDQRMVLDGDIHGAVSASPMRG